MSYVRNSTLVNKGSMGILFQEWTHIHIWKPFMGRHISEHAQFKVLVQGEDTHFWLYLAYGHLASVQKATKNRQLFWTWSVCIIKITRMPLALFNVLAKVLWNFTSRKKKTRQCIGACLHVHVHLAANMLGLNLYFFFSGTGGQTCVWHMLSKCCATESYLHHESSIFYFSRVQKGSITLAIIEVDTFLFSFVHLFLPFSLSAFPSFDFFILFSSFHWSLF